MDESFLLGFTGRIGSDFPEPKIIQTFWAKTFLVEEKNLIRILDDF